MPAGAGSCLGVTPSISLCPFGWTITRVNSILPVDPLSESGASVVGTIDRPGHDDIDLSLAFHHTAPSLVSSVGSVGLGSAWEASGAGSDFGVTPSISTWPLG